MLQRGLTWKVGRLPLEVPGDSVVSSEVGAAMAMSPLCDTAVFLRHRCAGLCFPGSGRPPGYIQLASGISKRGPRGPCSRVSRHLS